MRFFLLGNFAILSYNAQVELGYCSNFSNRERLKFLLDSLLRHWGIALNLAKISSFF